MCVCAYVIYIYILCITLHAVDLSHRPRALLALLLTTTCFLHPARRPRSARRCLGLEALDGYERLMEAEPVATDVATAALLNGASDAVAQASEAREKSAWRVLRYVAFGSLDGFAGASDFMVKTCENVGKRRKKEVKRHEGHGFSHRKHGEETSKCLPAQATTGSRP